MTQPIVDFNSQLASLRQTVQERTQAAEHGLPGTKAQSIVLSMTPSICEALSTLLWVAELTGNAPDPILVEAHLAAGWAILDAAERLPRRN